MSIARLKSRAKNESVFLQNRLARFTEPPMRTGDLYVEKDETIYGNLEAAFQLVQEQDQL
jgi:hypothetical protein